jgi:hypothetical protein
MKNLQMGVYQVFSNKSPWVRFDPTPGAYIQVSDFRAIMALLLSLCMQIVISISSKENGLKLHPNLRA